MTLNILALETSASRCGIALLRERDGCIDISVREHVGREEHAERLLPMASSLLEEAGLTPAALHAVAFGQGPGGFTGLRVACGVAQGMALALGIPVIGIVSHQAAAEAVPARPDQAIVVALDARMGEVYLAAYRRLDGADESTGWQALQAPILVAADEVVAWIEAQVPEWSRRASCPLMPVLAGDAWTAYEEECVAPAEWIRFDVLRPDAASVARLARLAWRRGETLDPGLAAPLYVRDKIAFTTAERANGSGGNPKAASRLAAATATPGDRFQGDPVGGAAVVGRLAAGVLPEPMRPEDLEAVAALEAHVQQFPWTRGNFADALEAGYGAWVLREDGRITGFCILMFAPDVAHLLVIAIDPDFHRSGRGSALIGWCEARARERGIAGLLLEVRPSNEKAIKFYEHHGFLRVGVRRGYYPAAGGQRENAVVMQKDVSQEGGS